MQLVRWKPWRGRLEPVALHICEMQMRTLTKSPAIKTRGLRSARLLAIVLLPAPAVTGEICK